MGVQLHRWVIAREGGPELQAYIIVRLIFLISLAICSALTQLRFQLGGHRSWVHAENTTVRIFLLFFFLFPN